MRILSLTSTLEKKLLAKRVVHDGEAQRVAAGIVADVQRRGDPAVLAWTKKFDDAAIRSKDFWISQKEVREAQHYVGAEFLRAIRPQFDPRRGT